MLVLSRQIYFTGYQSVLVVSLAAALIASAFVFAFKDLLGSSLDDAALDALVSLTVRGFAVQVPGFIFCARSITAVISELSLMSVTGEIRTLQRLGIDPFKYLLLPRLLAASLSMMILYLIFVAVTIASAVVSTALAAGVPLSLPPILALFEAINPAGLAVGLLRSALLAAIAILWVFRVEARGHSSFPEVSRAASFGVLRVMMIYLGAETIFQLLSFSLFSRPSGA
jgi:phospholipid/cholesterol/gamma-HCH transport system permease protein